MPPARVHLSAVVRPAGEEPRFDRLLRVVEDEVCRPDLVVPLRPDPLMVEREEGLATDARGDLHSQLGRLRQALSQQLMPMRTLFRDPPPRFLTKLGRESLKPAKLTARLPNVSKNPSNQGECLCRLGQDEAATSCWHGGRPFACPREALHERPREQTYPRFRQATRHVPNSHTFSFHPQSRNF